MATAAIVIGAVVVGAFVATAMFSAARPQTGSQKPQDIKFATNKFGIPIPEVLGTIKLAGNYIWTGEQRSEAIKSKSSSGGKGGGGGGSSSTIVGYKYYMHFALGICLGPVDKLCTIYREQELIWSGELICPASGVQTIQAEKTGAITFYFGTATQPPNENIGKSLPDGTLNTAYPGLCWAYFNDVFIGESPRVPTYHFVVQKAPAQSFGGTAVLSAYDYNPAHAIWHILTNMTGLPESWLDSASFLAASETLDTEGRGISMVFDEQKTALDYIDNVLSHVLGMLRFGADGRLYLALMRGDYDKETVPVITERECLEPPTLKRKSWVDTINEVKATYNQRCFAEGVKPVVLFALWIDESDPNYYPDGHYWYADLETARGKLRDIRQYADVYVKVFAVSPGNITRTDVDWPSDIGVRTDCPRGPSFSFLRDEFKKLIPSGRESSPGFVGLTVDTSGSMNMSTIEPAYSELKDWIGSALPSYSMLENTQARSDERWLSWLAADIDVSFPGVNYREGISDPSSVNIANQQIQGRTESQTLSLPLFTMNSNASWAAREALRKDSYPLATLNVTLSRDAFMLQPGDVFKFSFAPYGIESMFFRLKQVDEEDLEHEAIGIVAEEEYTVVSETMIEPPETLNLSSPPSSYMIGGDPVVVQEVQAVPLTGGPIAIGTVNPWEISVSWNGIEMIEGEDYTVDLSAGTITPIPGGSITPGMDLTIESRTNPQEKVRFYELPYLWAGEEIKVLPVVSRPNVLNSGYQIFYSASGTSYEEVGTSSAFAVHGTVVRDYPKTFQIDDEICLDVFFPTSDVMSIESCTREQLLSQRNLALIGDELITFQSIEPLTGKTYRLTGVYRGRYGTEMSEHLRGTDFFFLGSNTAEPITNPDFLLGETRYFKAVQYNPRYQGDESFAVPVEVVFTGRAIAPLPPVNLLANDEGFHPEYTSGISLVWDARVRGSGAGVHSPTQPDTAPAREGTFQVRVMDGSTEKLKRDGINAFSCELSESTLTSAGAFGSDLRIEVTNYRVVDGFRYYSAAASLTVYYGG
jgi:hypothetical protein